MKVVKKMLVLFMFISAFTFPTSALASGYNYQQKNTYQTYVYQVKTYYDTSKQTNYYSSSKGNSHYTYRYDCYDDYKDSIDIWRDWYCNWDWEWFCKWYEWLWGKKK
ncbi:hypothetical protein MUG87_00780 [Ectobacillus sp. JY-23]|uniref:hypothetical protein n=1 Tax=Ectobacillus sp. JY-23 TaxID=2933872 RepID=UPI001FF25742|nr:hypothetical protein [Ectobacillus sp. JY-23]UOY92719.1 hypothetical protein MUG87_00780 [Ectobacillus sp. JY-23]